MINPRLDDIYNFAPSGLKEYQISSSIIENYQFNVIESGNTCLNTCLLGLAG
jgi:hypothetical protein